MITPAPNRICLVVTIPLVIEGWVEMSWGIVYIQEMFSYRKLSPMSLLDFLFISNSNIHA
jgi:hypothetical protein